MQARVTSQIVLRSSATLLLIGGVCLGACGSSPEEPGSTTPSSGGVSAGGGHFGETTGGGENGGYGGEPNSSAPLAGNPEADGSCDIPDDARPEDVSSPTTVVGTGTPASCTAEAFTSAVENGGTITFDCGAAPHTIVLSRPAKVRNDRARKVTIDGGGRITLSGGGTTRILYMNTCDPEQVFTTSHCDNQDHPILSVQNLTFVNGNSKNEAEDEGGGAIFASGGRVKVINSRFFSNVCSDTGPDLAGAALRVFQQFENRPAYIVNSTFGGDEERGNQCSNGGAVGSIGVNWHIVNSLFSYNRAVGNGGNPKQEGTPGGGSGGAIYSDGGTLKLHLCGTKIEENAVNAHGSAVFFISNNHQGTLEIEKSKIQNNHGGSWYALPGISMHEDTVRVIDAESTLSE
jgi:hypothetical protein